jgi:hypothetical protein
MFHYSCCKRLMFVVRACKFLKFVTCCLQLARLAGAPRPQPSPNYHHTFELATNPTTTANMPKDVKQKSGIIAGINAGHSTSSRPPRTERTESTPRKFWRKAKNGG